MENERTDGKENAVVGGGVRKAKSAFWTSIEPALNGLLGDKPCFMMPIVEIGEGGRTTRCLNVIQGEGNLKIGEFGERSIC